MLGHHAVIVERLRPVRRMTTPMRKNMGALTRSATCGGRARVWWFIGLLLNRVDRW